MFSSLEKVWICSSLVATYPLKDDKNIETAGIKVLNILMTYLNYISRVGTLPLTY